MGTGLWVESRSGPTQARHTQRNVYSRNAINGHLARHVNATSPYASRDCATPRRHGLHHELGSGPGLRVRPDSESGSSTGRSAGCRVTWYPSLQLSLEIQYAGINHGWNSYLIGAEISPAHEKGRVERFTRPWLIFLTSFSFSSLETLLWN